MDGILILLAVAFAAMVLIGVPAALIRQVRLGREMRHLKEEVARLRQRLDGGEAASAPEVRVKEASSKAQAEVKSEARAGPWTSKNAQSETPESAPTEEPYVFRQSRFAALGAWLRENWVLGVAAASLAFAGVFLVQYGVENGLLTPFWRVMAALGFGSALVTGGEAMRRRFGDAGPSDTRYLPSTLSGAGIIVLFAAVLAARQLYGLISPGAALAGLIAVALLAVLLGWFYGAALAAIGVLGAGAAPFVVGGSSEAPWLFYYYYLIIGCVALGIDTMRRWAWVSALGLAVGFGGMALLYLGGAGALHFVVSVALLVMAALAVPVRRLMPDHSGAGVLQLMRGKAAGVAFPTRLAGAAVAAGTAAGLAVIWRDAGVAEVSLGFGLLFALMVLLVIWAASAEALGDQVLMPAGAFLFAVFWQGWDGGVLFEELLRAVPTDVEVAGADTLWVIYALLGAGVLGSLMAFWRMRQGAEIWALLAAVFAPAVLLVLEFVWPVREVLGAYPWALVAMAVAALMVLLAGAARGRQLAVALLAIAALTMIALALFVVLTKAALSLALAAMVVLVVLVDRRFDLPLLGAFVQLGVAVISYRMVLDPGFIWALEEAALWEVLLGYGGVVALLALAWALYPSADHRLRRGGRLAVESGAWVIAGVGLAVLLARGFEDDLLSHWGFGLLAAIGVALALVQLHRLQGSVWRAERWVRYTLVAFFALGAAALMAVQAVFVNPVFAPFGEHPVRGPVLFDSLALAYLPLAALFGFAAWRYGKGLWRGLLWALSGLYGATYLALELRRLFRGRDLSVSGFTDGELYGYTVLMLVTSVALLLLAYQRRLVPLRKLAMAGVALTIAKVFLVDMSGLAGLMRVVSFMGLGLALLGLAWLNRKISAGWDVSEGAADEGTEEGGDGRDA